MLTKEERKAIAERARECNYIYDNGLYKILFNNSAPTETSLEEDNKAVLARLIDLCDTSNMVELPRDKDGEVIRVGDTVYYGGSAYKVKKIIHNGNEWEIQFFDDRLCISIYADPNDLTHKKPVTIASITERIREIASNDDDISYCTSSELVRIADQLEKLGDSDD